MINVILYKQSLMQQRQKAHRSKIRTLCTIDTSDIDLHDIKNKNNNNNSVTHKNKNKNKFIQSPIKNTDKIRDMRQDNQNKNSNNYQHYDIEIGNSKVGSVGDGINGVRKMTGPSRSVGKYFIANHQHHNKRQHTITQHSQPKKRSKSILNKTMQKSRSRIKTQYSTSNQQTFKQILTKSLKTLKNKSINPLQQTHNIQTYQIIQQLQATSTKQKIYLAKKQDKYYLMKKTKDKELKQLYQKQWNNKQYLSDIKWKNLQKIVKIYVQKNYLYAIYQYTSNCLSWNNHSHMQVIDKILHNQATVLKHIIKQTAKAINQLSSKAYTHSRINLQCISIKIQQLKTTIRIEGNVKLTNLFYAFHIKDKNNLFNLPQTIYTAPQIINLKLFQQGQKFDRELIQYISCYDQGWYLDVWALGITILQLIAGEAISIEKVDREKKICSDASLQIESQGSQQSQKQLKLKDLDLNIEKSKKITLADILQAQKSLLKQTSAVIQKISFDKKLQNLLIRMLSMNPLTRPSPKQIIKDLSQLSLK